MCGIVGTISTQPIEDREWLSIGSERMSHRGPDDLGEWWSSDYRVGLAQRRLSIIELSRAGHQPMHSDDSMITVVFNGEIYNYLELRSELAKLGCKFKSSSDTEVIIAAYQKWGTDCLKKFNGMFAFCIYDDLNKRAFLARDRAGEKPIFLYISENGVRFASELKALLADNRIPRNIDHQALCSYLELGFVPNDGCLLKGFKKLPPAHAIIYDLNKNKIKEWSYWYVPDFEAEINTVNKSADVMELSYELENLLSDSVRMQLTADVPVGVLLSGGLDSSLITALAARNSSKIKTFTISFPEFSQHDESPHARLISDHYGTEHTELVVESASAELLPLLACQYDEPIADSSMIPTFLISRKIKEFCSVALGGDGGDELFGGYTHYSRLLWLDSKLSTIPFFLRKLTSRFASNNIPLGFRGGNLRTYLMLLSADFKNGIPNSQGLFDKISIQRLLRNHKIFSNISFIDSRNKGNISSDIFEKMDIIQKATRADFLNYLPEDILVKVDRASMLNSVEIRAPLLDFRVIEFAFGKVPSHLKVAKNNKKVLLKEMAKHILPKEFDFNRKQGFSIPLKIWLESGQFRELFWFVLTDDNCLFDKEYVLKLLKDQDDGRDNSERLFSLVILELWRNEYEIGSTLC